MIPPALLVPANAHHFAPATFHHAPVPAPAPSVASRPRPALACLAHAGRDLVCHGAARLAGLGFFSLITENGAGATLGAKVVAGTAGALAAGTQAWLIAKEQIGTHTCPQRCAVALCTVACAAAGAGIAVCGATQPVVTLAAGTISTVLVSTLRIGASLPVEEKGIDEVKAAIGLISTATAALAVACVDQQWQTRADVLAARNVSALAESIVIELGKSTLEHCGPHVDRNSLPFNWRAAASLAGVVPYVAAAVLFNGVCSSLLLGQQDRTSFSELALPVMIGILANAVRAASNAAWCCLLAPGTGNGDAAIVRPSKGLRLPKPGKVAQKAAVRLFLLVCRNAVYQRLRDHGLGLMPAACIAHLVYALFAQQRELVLDLMQGSGWNEPRLIAHAKPASSQPDLPWGASSPSLN